MAKTRFNPTDKEILQAVTPVLDGTIKSSVVFIAHNERGIPKGRVKATRAEKTGSIVLTIDRLNYREQLYIKKHAIPGLPKVTEWLIPLKKKKA